VAADACWAVDVRDLRGRLWGAEDVHQLALAVMNREYATVSDTAALVSAAAMAKAVRMLRRR
jgi:hypothetical protein